MANVSLPGVQLSILQALQADKAAIQTSSNRLATGRKINNVLDDPNVFFQANTLNTQANALMQYSQAAGQSIQTIRTASDGLDLITSLLEQVQALGREALDTSRNIASLEAGISITAAQRGDIELIPGINDGDRLILTVGDDPAVTINITAGDSLDDFATAISAIDGVEASIVDDEDNPGNFRFIVQSTSGDDIGIRDQGTGVITGMQLGGQTLLLGPLSPSTSLLSSAVGVEATDSFRLTVDGETTLRNIGTETLASMGALLAGDFTNVEASVNDEDVLVIRSTVDAPIFIETDAGAGLQNLGLTIRADKTAQEADQITAEINQLLEQINFAIQDASYRGVNLLAGDDLRTAFSGDREDSLTVAGVTLSVANLLSFETANIQGLEAMQETISSAQNALEDVRDQKTRYESSMSVVQRRINYNEAIRNTLFAGNDRLTLADVNEEAAIQLALETSQQLKINALSLAADAEDAVLQMF